MRRAGLGSPCVGERALGNRRDRTTYLSVRTLSGAYRDAGAYVLGSGCVVQGRSGDRGRGREDRAYA